MTAERYTALCNDRPECYPEAGYGLASRAHGHSCVVRRRILLLLGLIQALIWPFRWLASR